jgi:DNA-directed RNA polymerase specialized sigma24 family protein
MPYRPPTDIHPAARGLIRYKKQPLVGNFGFTRDDADDIEQELALRAHLATPAYDPDRGTASAFFGRVLTNAARNLANAAARQKRDRRRVTPFDAVALRTTVDADAGFRLDVADALASLPPTDRAVADLLVDDTVAGASRSLGMTRGQVRSARARIARRLTAAGVARDSLGSGQPFGARKLYVSTEGANQDRNSRLAGPEGKVVGVPPSPGARSAYPRGKGASP